MPPLFDGSAMSCECPGEEEEPTLHLWTVLVRSLLVSCQYYYPWCALFEISGATGKDVTVIPSSHNL